MRRKEQGNQNYSTSSECPEIIQSMCPEYAGCPDYTGCPDCIGCPDYTRVS